MYFYPVHVFVCAAGLRVWLVCVYMYVICGQQKWAVWGLTTESLP